MSSKSEQRQFRADYIRQTKGGEPEQKVFAGYGESVVDDGSVLDDEYLYQDKDRMPYLLVRRFKPKAFRQLHWEGHWVWGKPDGPKIPYYLPELIAAPAGTPIYVTEGEKDTDNVGDLGGMVVTCASEGAGKWTEDLNAWFKGKGPIFILEDNDDPGRAHARMVARNLEPLVSEVRIVSFPELASVPPGPDGKPKKDVSDWLELGHTKDELIAKCMAAPIFKSAPAMSGGMSARELFHQEFPPLKYIIPGLLVEGLTLFAGTPKIGKSWLWLEAALAIGFGGYCLGDRKCPEGDVLYLAYEDNPRRLNNRIKKLWEFEKGQPPECVTFHTQWPRTNEGGIERIREWLDAHPGALAVIVDVLANIKQRSKGRDQTSYDFDYESLRALQALALERHIAVVAIHHTRKSTGGSDPFEEVSGTLGLNGAADTIAVLRRFNGNTTLHIRGRDIEEAELAVRFDKVTSKWSIQGDAADVHHTHERGQVLNVLKKATEPMKPGDLALACGTTTQQMNVRLTRMVKANEVVRTERGKYVHPDRNDLMQL